MATTCAYPDCLSNGTPGARSAPLRSCAVGTRWRSYTTALPLTRPLLPSGRPARLSPREGRMFWKRTTPGARGSREVPAIDSDGKRRVFGEAVFAGKHGQMLKSLGFDLNDPANVIPDDAEFDRRIKE